VDNNGVSQAELMTDWQLILEKTDIPQDTIDDLISRISQTESLGDYMELRESMLEQVSVLLK
jgi:hypothetical protein